MRISDWSSDVCSSDLLVAGRLGFSPTDDQRALLQRSMSFLKPRAANLLDLADGAQFLFRKRPLEMDDDAANLLGGDAPKLLARIHVALAALADWNAAAAEAAVRSVAEAEGVKLGAVAHTLREEIG